MYVRVWSIWNQAKREAWVTGERVALFRLPWLAAVLLSAPALWVTEANPLTC